MKILINYLNLGKVSSPISSRDDQHGVLRVVINVTDSEFVAPVIRDDLMTLDSESVWLTFTNDDKNELRIGVNPAGDAIVQFVHDGDEWIDSDVDITDEMAVRCQYPAMEGGPADYRDLAHPCCCQTKLGLMR